VVIWWNENIHQHVKGKAPLSDLFGFTLHLEYDNEYKPASLEAMFLPYYIAQDVGWVYRHKSFRGLDFAVFFKVVVTIDRFKRPVFLTL
jgi:hypothetical protein